MSSHYQKGSRIVGAEIAGEQVLARQARTAKRWLMTQDRAADFLADLVFVTLMLLLFVWVGLWTSGSLEPAERFDAATAIQAESRSSKELAQKEDDMGSPAKLTMRSSKTSRPNLLYCLRAASLVALATLLLVGKETSCRIFQYPAGSS